MSFDSESQGRTLEQLRHHYSVEKELASQLRVSTREERSVLFGKLYQELFDRVPDHPRLVRRDTPEFSRRSIAARLRLLKPFLSPRKTFLEFAPGDCRLLAEAAPLVEKAIGVDISDQRGEDAPPAGFQLVIYDGYHLDLPPASVDVLFSYQFLEHLHPADVDLHFALAYRLLRPGGVYVFATPHRISGPHDVSRHFSDTPEGFHLKEWTYCEMFEVLKRAGFVSASTYRSGKPRHSRAVTALTLALEAILTWIPNRKWQRRLSRDIFQSVTMVAFK
jgi:SAM-dependent methyltransferase